MRGVNLQNNKLGEKGIQEMLLACRYNINLITVDVTKNSPVYEGKQFDV